MFTSADLKGLIQNAQLSKMSDALQALQDGGDENQEFGISREDVLLAFDSFSRGMSTKEILRFNKIYSDF